MDTYLERERDRFAVAQKQKNGLVHLNVEIRKEQALWGGESDVWILPEEMVAYTTLVRSEMVDYDKAGPRGPDRRDGYNAGATSLATGNDAGKMDRIEPTRMVAGTPAYIARSFYVDGIGKEDLLARTKQIGGYCTMFDENVDYNNYSSASRDIALYNEDIDDFSKIKFSDFIRNCGLWDVQSGDLIHPGRGGRMNRRNRDDINRDLDRDFLTYVDDRGAQPERRNIQFIGDIAEEFFTTEDAENAGLTVLNAVRNAAPNSQQAINTLEQEIANASTRLAGAGLPIEVTDALNIIGNLAQTIDALIGGSNLFTNFTMRDIQGGSLINSPIGAFYRTFVATGGVPIVRDLSGGAPISSQATGGVSKEQLGQGFLRAFKSKIPESHHATIDSIIDGQGSVMERAEKIRDEMKRMVGQNIEGFEFSNARSVTKLFNGLKKNYETQLEKTSTATPVASQVSGDVERRLVYPGRRNLPAGWRYENPAHANVAYVGYQPTAPTRFEHIHALASMMSSTPVAQQQRQGGIRAQGHGLQNIGQFNFGEDDEVLARQRQRRAPGAGNDMQKRFRNLVDRMGKIANGAARPAVKVCAIMYLGARVNRDVFLAMYRNNIVVPFGGLVCRPHATYRTRYAIKCLSGGGSGNTFFGHSDMQIEHDAARKLGMMHYTCYMASVVTQPRNVYVVPDVFSQDYLGGLGIGMWDPQEYKNRGDDHTKKSIICIAVPPAERDNIPVKFDIAGRWYTHFRMGLVRQERFEELHYSTAFRYNRLYGFHDPLNRAREMGGPNFRAGDVGVNRVMWRDMQFNYNTKSGQFDKVRINQGHFGPNVYAGCGQVRKGKSYELKEMNYASFSSN